MSDKVLVKKLLEKYDPGEDICKEGDEGQDMYIIKSGKVEVLKEMGGSEMKLATLGPKDFFGEMALFSAHRRTAGVRAVEHSVVIVVTKKMLETQFRKVPEWLVTMIKTIANRIITTSKGVRNHFRVGLEYTLLKTIYLVGILLGNPTKDGTVIPIDMVRDEIMYTVGISYDEIDVWLKRFNLVNFVSIKGGSGMLEIPNTNRINLYADYLFSQSREGIDITIEIDSDTLKSFERIRKLLKR